MWEFKNDKIISLPEETQFKSGYGKWKQLFIKIKSGEQILATEDGKAVRGWSTEHLAWALKYE